jgi:mycoredoxin
MVQLQQKTYERDLEESCKKLCLYTSQKNVYNKKMQNTIIFYGATWCPDCWVSKKFLDNHRIEYKYIDLEKVPDAADVVQSINGGMQSIPTIILPNNTVLVEPSNEELQAALAAAGIL